MHRLIPALMGATLFACQPQDELPLPPEGAAPTGGGNVEAPFGEPSGEVEAPEVGEDGYSVDPGLFLAGAMNLSISEAPCTLSDGTETECWVITTPTGFPYGTPAEERPYCQGGYGYGDDLDFSEAESLYDCEGIGAPGQGDPPDGDIQCFNCAAIANTFTYTIPKVPVPQDEPVDLAEGSAVSLGYGIALDGVLLSEPTPTKATAPPYPAVDPCGGHATPPGDYHYHFIPAQADRFDGSIECLVEGGDPSGTGHSAMFGYALDGYPIHGRFGDDGEVPADLDECRGHVHSTREFPEGVYHYHAEHLVDASQAGIDDSERFYTFNGCFKGAIGFSTYGGGAQGGPPGGDQQGAPPGADEQAAPPMDGEIPACAQGQTERCCGDGTCDGPETAENCAADCGQ